MRRESGLMGHQGPEKDTDWKRRGALARDGAENWQGPCAREGTGVPRAESTGQELREDPLEEETAPPAISCLENPLGSGAGGLQSTRSHRV